LNTCDYFHLKCNPAVFRFLNTVRQLLLVSDWHICLSWPCNISARGENAGARGWQAGVCATVCVQLSSCGYAGHGGVRSFARGGANVFSLLCVGRAANHARLRRMRFFYVEGKDKTREKGGLKGECRCCRMTSICCALLRRRLFFGVLFATQNEFSCAA